MAKKQPKKNGLVIVGSILIVAAFITFILKKQFFERYYGTHSANHSLEAAIFTLQAIAAYSGCAVLAIGAMQSNKEGRAARISGTLLLFLAFSALVTLAWAILWVKAYI